VRPTAVFLCGDHSRYGWAHTEPILDHFDVRLVIVASSGRWKTFRRGLMASAAGGPDPQAGLGRLVRGGRHRVREARVRHRHLRFLAERGVRSTVTGNANSAPVIEQIRRLEPEVLLSAAYPRIFKSELLAVAPRGAVNFHPSLLPRYRGAHPHYWSIADGAEATGISAHFMSERVDEGDVIAQVPVPIDGAYYAEVVERILEATPSLVAKVASFLATDGAVATKQDSALATYFHNDGNVDHRLAPSAMEARTLWNRVRAGSAFVCVHGRQLPIVRCEVEDGAPAPDVAWAPGLVTKVDDIAIWVWSEDGRLVRLERPPSSKVGQLLRLDPTSPQPGDVLDSI
jgi:methionyl-tRNA formyltransferase